MLMHLATTTLITALRHEPNWDNQIEIARQLERRTDLFNIVPLLEFLLDARQHRSVHHAVAKCVARHSSSQAIKWMESRVLDSAVSVDQKTLALRALADFACPGKVVPLLIRICDLPVPSEVCTAALFRLGRSGSLLAASTLLRLSRSRRRPWIAGEARRALAYLVEHAGGPGAAISGLLQLASADAGQGQRRDAMRKMVCAMRLSRDQTLAQGHIYRELRQMLAA